MSMSSILEEKQMLQYKGIGNVWFRNTSQTYLITIGTSNDDLSCPANIFIKLSNNNFEKPIFFETKIYKSSVNHNNNYFVKTISIPKKYTDSIPKDTKTINYHIQVIPSIKSIFSSC